MGTSYELTKGRHKLVIDEMSNKLDLSLDCDLDTFESYLIIEDAEPADIMRVLLEGLKTCSYYMNSREFKSVLSELEDYSVA